jgi:hypothetical protein
VNAAPATKIRFHLVCALMALTARPLLACTACYGQSDSPLAQGMNWGILCLLGVIAGVLSGIVVFFVHAVKRSAAVERGNVNPPSTSQA